MKRWLLAAGFIAAAVSGATAQYAPYSRTEFPYAQKYHTVCQEKAHRLFEFEKRAGADGRISVSERGTMRSLERDLARTCGGYRFHG